MNKFYETLTNLRGDVLFGYRAQVVDATGAIVDIYRDRSGTRFTDGSGNIVNYAEASSDTGMAEFYWTAATGQLLQITDGSGKLARSPIEGFGDNYVLNNLSGDLPTSAIDGLDDDLAAKADVTYVDDGLASKVPTGDLASPDGAEMVGVAAGGTAADFLNYITAESRGATGDGSTSDVASLQQAIDDAASASISGVSQRTAIKLRPGRQYVIDADVRLKRVSIDARGAGFLMKNNASFLVGADSAFISDGNTQIICENAYSDAVFKRDPAEASVVRLHMIGSAGIVRLGTVDMASGIGVDMTGFYRSVVDVDVRNMDKGVYCFPEASTQQTYYNRIAIRVNGVGYGVHMKTQDFQLSNGNTFWVSHTNVKKGIFFEALGPASGSSANTFILSYIEQFSEAGIHMDGEVSHNTVIGGILEAGAGSNVPCIKMANGAANNKIITTCSPAGQALALEALDCGANDYFLGAYGTYQNWSDDIGQGLPYATRRNSGVHVGGLNNKKLAVVHDSDASATIDGSGGPDFVRLDGSGSVTNISVTGMEESNRITIIGNGTATVAQGTTGFGQLYPKGGVDVIPPNRGMITFVRIGNYSEAWFEESRGF